MEYFVVASNFDIRSADLASLNSCDASAKASFLWPKFNFSNYFGWQDFGGPHLFDREHSRGSTQVAKMFRRRRKPPSDVMATTHIASMLDELMGRNRNDINAKELSWTDADVCKYVGIERVIELW